MHLRIEATRHVGVLDEGGAPFNLELEDRLPEDRPYPVREKPARYQSDTDRDGSDEQTVPQFDEVGAQTHLAIGVLSPPRCHCHQASLLPQS